MPVSPSDRGYELLELLDPLLLEEIHEAATRHGRVDRAGVRNRGALVHLAQKLGEMGEAREPPEMIAAYGMWYVIMEQVFSDGNHRTAMALGLFVLQVFGLDLPMDERELARFVRSIDTRGLSPEQIGETIAAQMVRK
ncbi:MAG: hypothetical protein HY558_08210 [Euryarchaeota archaeon]|nr:hypothetical protein [Euryarchaeota archaeon]